MFCTPHCLMERHAPSLILLALPLAALGASIAVLAARQAAVAAGRRLPWMAGGSLAFGAGIWGFQALALLAFDFGAAAEFRTTPAAVAAISALAGAGVGVSVLGTHDGRPAAMLAALWIAIGALTSEVGLLAAVLPEGAPAPGPFVLTAVLPGIALLVGAAPLVRRDPAAASVAAAMMALGLPLLHAGVVATLSPGGDPHDGGDHAPLWPVLPIAVLGLAALAATLVAAGMFGSAEARSAQAARLRSLADTAFEGIAVCEGETVLEANAALGALVGAGGAAMAGRQVPSLFEATDRVAVLTALLRATGEPFLAGLTGPKGRIPVEVRVRRLPDEDGQPRCALTLRDLSAVLDAEARIRYLANHDPLTGLANRARLAALARDWAAEVLDRRSGLAALVLDIDRFKLINDRYGHAAGDEVLGEVAERIRATLGQGEFVARLGGDEFALLLKGGDAAAPRRLAERLLAAFARPVRLADGTEVPVAAAIGCALLPEDTEDPEELVRHAGTAAGHAKSEGTGWAAFRPAMDVALRARRAVEGDLPGAASRGELRLVYQRQVSIRTGRAVGFEALMRWRRPGLGEVSPAEFIPLAEASGEIVAMGAWALRRACQDAMRLPVRLRVSVNVSPLQIERGGLPEAVESALAATGLPPERLELEVTEGLLIRDGARAQGQLGRIRDMGVRLALDDFGAGYASLSTLLSFRFDKVKMDRALVTDVGRDPRATAVVRATLGLARDLGLAVVAEGVETEAQLELLRAEGCDDIQGYISGGPVELETLIAEVTTA